MRDRRMISNKIVKLVVMIEMVQRCLSNNITSYFADPNNTSVLIINNNYNCTHSYINQNPFEGVYWILQHLANDYVSSNGKLSKKPSTIIMTLNLVPPNNICYIKDALRIYNPFILGNYSPQYKANRTKSGDTSCCLQLEQTYDFQLIIQGPAGQKVEIREQGVQYAMPFVHFYYFPTIKIRNIAFKQKYMQIYQSVFMYIHGYEFGKKIGQSPASEGLKRFKNSKLIIENITINSNVVGLIMVSSTYNQVNFSSWNVESYQTQSYLVHLTIDRHQLDWLSSQENKIIRQKYLRHQVIYDFSRFNIVGNISKTQFAADAGYTKKGMLIGMVIDDPKSHNTSFKIKVVIKNWNIQRSRIDSYNAAYRQFPLFIVNQYKQQSKAYTTEIENITVTDCLLDMGLFDVSNLVKFNNIKISNNLVQSNRNFIKTNIIRSHNVEISHNQFYFKFSFLAININDLIDKSMALQKNYQSIIKKWNFQNNKIISQLSGLTDDFRSLIHYNVQEHAVSNDLGSNLMFETQKLKKNLGLLIDDLQIQNTESDKAKTALPIFQHIKILCIEKAFNFELTNSKFINNQFLTSNVVSNTSYIDINNVVLDKNSVPYQVAYNSSIPTNEIVYTRVFNILYFFNINSFHKIQISNIYLKSMVFESSLFKIEETGQQLLQTTINGKYSIIDVKSIEIKDGIYLKPSGEHGSSLIHVSSKNPVKFTFSNSTINKLRMYQQMGMKNDMALIVYFNDTVSSKSQFIAQNLNITNNGFQYRKGLFVIQAQKVSFDNISFSNNQYQDPLQFQPSNGNKFVVKFIEMESKGCMMDVHAQKVEINNVRVDRSQSKEAAVLKLVVDHPTDPNSLGLNDSDLHVIKVQNSRFTNIMTHSGSILFDIDLNGLYQTMIKNNLVLSFDKLKVDSVFSLNSGPIFKIYNMAGQRIDIINSEFKNFKSKQKEQLIQYSSKPMAFTKWFDLLLNHADSEQYEQYKRNPRLNIQSCIIDNMKMINKFISQFYLIDLQNNEYYLEDKNQWDQDKQLVDRLMAYTDKTRVVQVDSNFYNTFFMKISNIDKSKFMGGQLISSDRSILSIKDSVISNIEPYQAGSTYTYPLVLEAKSSADIMIQNTTFTNLNFNQKGLFGVFDDCKFSLKDCRFNQVYDLHYDNNTFEQQIKQQQVFSPDDDYTVYNIFNNDIHRDESKQFKGGLVAKYSTLEIVNNRFERMKCKECSGLVLSAIGCAMKAMNNKFIDNSAYQATCIYIDAQEYTDLKEVSEIKGSYYRVSNATMEISNNTFINNSAISNSAGIYIKDIMMISIEHNRFENNKAQYGTCLYSTQQSNEYNRSIITYKNQLINNTAMSVGQIYYKDIFVYNIKSNEFINNRAGQFSSKVFSYPYKFELNIDGLDKKSGLVENQYVLNNFGSNQQIIPLQFVFYDEIDEKMNLNQYISSQSKFVEIISIESIQTVFSDKIEKSIYQKQQSKQINKAEFTSPRLINPDHIWVNNNLKISASPLSQVIIEFKTNIIKRFNKTTKSFVSTARFKLIINFRECQVGEYYDKEQNYCQKCPVNTFSFNVNEPCKRYEKVQLMEHAYGEYKTSVKKGAWRYQNNTENIINCSNPKHCEPDLQRFPDASNSSGNHLCRTGHVGPLCQSCDNYGVFWNQSYQYSAKDKACVSCSNSSWTIIYFFIVLIGIGLLAIFTINRQVVAGQNLSLRQKLKNIRHLMISKSHRFLMASQRILANKTYCSLKQKNTNKTYPMKLKYKEKDDGYSYDVYVLEGDEKTKQEMNILQLDFNEIIQPTALIKIMATYFLIFSITIQSTKDQFKGLDSIQSVFRTAGEPIKQASYSLECLIISFGIKDIPVYVIKDVLTILSPLINWLVFLIIWRIILRSKLDKPVLINSLTFITFYNYPQIIRTIFPAVIRQRQDGIDYVQTDPKFIYRSQQQFYLRVFFYAPVLLFFLVVLPTMTILLLRKYKQKLFEPNFKMKFGFLYQEYRKECYYIEVVKVGVKVSIIMFQSIYIDSLQLQISIIQQILLVYLIIIILVKPYTQHSTNAIELQNIILCLLNMILVNSIHWSQQADCSIATIMFMVIMVVFNSVFILVLFYLLFNQKIIEMNEKMINLKYTLLNKVPKLKKIKYLRFYTIGMELNTKARWQSLFKILKQNKFRIQKQVKNDYQNTSSKTKDRDKEMSQKQKQNDDNNQRKEQSGISNNRNNDDQNVGVDDIVQYFKSFGQQSKDNVKKENQIKDDRQSSKSKPISKNESPKILDTRMKRKYEDSNELTSKKHIASKNNEKVTNKSDQIFKMNDAALFKRIGYKNK